MAFHLRPCMNGFPLAAVHEWLSARRLPRGFPLVDYHVASLKWYNPCGQISPLHAFTFFGGVGRCEHRVRLNRETQLAFGQIASVGHVLVMWQSCANHVSAVCRLYISHVPIMCQPSISHAPVMCRSYASQCKRRSAPSSHSQHGSPADRSAPHARGSKHTAKTYH